MLVIVGESFADRIRSILKRWFVEPKPNIFVGHVNERVKNKLLDYIRCNCEGLKYILIYADERDCQHFFELKITVLKISIK